MFAFFRESDFKKTTNLLGLKYEIWSQINVFLDRKLDEYFQYVAMVTRYTLPE